MLLAIQCFRSKFFLLIVFLIFSIAFATYGFGIISHASNKLYAQEEDPQKLLQEGRTAYLEARFNEAIKKLELSVHLLTEKEDLIEAYLYLSLSYFAFRNADKVKINLTELVKLNPKMVLDSLIVPPEVIELFNEVKKETLAVLLVETNPSGAAIYADGEFQGNSPVEIKDLLPGEYSIKATLRGYQKTEREISIIAGITNQETIELTKEGITVKPKVVTKQEHAEPSVIVEESKSLDFYLNKANQLFADRNYAKAKEYYQKILSIIPDDTFAMARIQECDEKIAEEKKRMEEAERETEELKKVDYYRKAAQELFDAGKHSQAIAYYQRILAVLPEDEEAKHHIALFRPMPWPMFRGDLQHTGRSPYKGPEKPHLKWAFTTRDKIISSPSIGANSIIYVGSIDNKLYAINPDGSMKWVFATKGEIYSSPAIGADGIIYIGSRDGKLYAIKPNGSKKWVFATRYDIYMSSPTIGEDGTIYLGSDDGKLYAINPDGSLKWTFATRGPVNSSPAIGADGTIYVGSLDHNIYAINHNGSLEWKFATIGIVQSSPAIGVDGIIYVGSNEGKLYAIKPDGSKKWDFTTKRMISSSPAIGADGTIYVGSLDKKLYAINPNASEKWEFCTNGWVSSSPAIGADGTIYVGSYDKKLYAINPDGSIKWEFATRGSVGSSPAIGRDGTIYVGSQDGKLYAIGK